MEVIVTKKSENTNLSSFVFRTFSRWATLVGQFLLID